MRYPAAETAEKHTRILNEAARLFRERGFADVSVAEIMKATGLTHGPFYNHFASKQALMAEAIAHASAESLRQIDATHSCADGRDDYLATYLSTAHRDHPGAGCLIAALATETSREPSVRPSFTAHLKKFIDKMASHFPWGRSEDARAETIRAIALAVGALVMARAVDDEALSAEILREAAPRRD